MVMVLHLNSVYWHKTITTNPPFVGWSPIVSVNCSDSFALSIAVCKNIPQIFCEIELYSQSQSSFPLYMCCVCFSRHSRWKQIQPLSLFATHWVTAGTPAKGDITHIPSKRYTNTWTHWPAVKLELLYPEEISFLWPSSTASTLKGNFTVYYNSFLF